MIKKQTDSVNSLRMGLQTSYFQMSETCHFDAQVGFDVQKLLNQNITLEICLTPR